MVRGTTPFEGAAGNLHEYYLFGWLLGQFWLFGCELAYHIQSFFVALFTPNNSNLWYDGFIQGIKQCDLKFKASYY